MHGLDPAKFPVGHVDIEEAVRNIDGDRELFGSVAEMMIADAPGYLVLLRNLLSKGMLADARLTAHTLKGVAGSVGAFRLMALARRLESEAIEGNREGTGQLLAALDIEMAAVVARLDEHVNR